MLSVKEAEDVIFELIKPVKETETVPIDISLGRILATEIASNLDFPYYDNSAMDGYAVKYADVSQCSQSEPVILEIVEEIPAGAKPKKTLQGKQAARIFTGALLPTGADTIVIQENTKRKGDQVSVFSPPDQQGSFVRKKGAFYQAGKTLLFPGLSLKAPDIAILATAGYNQVSVYRRLRVAIFSTGDELIPPQQSLQPGQIIDSNQPAIAAFVSDVGAIPRKFGIVPDQPELLKKTMTEAIASSDVVLSTGGVSVGDYDYVEKILTELGGTIHISSVAVKPGKPLTVATFPNGCLYFGIPGNPVSALVTCWRFVQPALKKLSGFQGNCQPLWLKARSRAELRSDGKRETYFWGNLCVVDGHYQFELAKGSQNSANLINLAQTNGLAVLKVGKNLVSPGQEIEVMQV